MPTRDHKKIRDWALRHNANPAQIKPLKFDGEPAILTFLIGKADAARPQIAPISWETFFAIFDLLHLAMAFDEATPRFDIVRIDKPGKQSLQH